MQWNKGTLYLAKLALELLLARVHHHAGALAEQEFLHLDKAVQLTLEDLPGIDLVDLPLIQEYHLVDRFVRGHGYCPVVARRRAI